jgi:putative peptidoglycan lipid II flippase
MLINQIGMWFAIRTASGAPGAFEHLHGYAHNVANNVALGNATLIYVLPHSILTVSIATALFTSMSAAAGRNDRTQVRELFERGIRLNGVVAILATTLMVVLALPLTRLLIPSGRAADIPAVANAVVALSLGLVPLGITLFQKRVFYAWERVRAVFYMQIPTTAIYMCGVWAAQSFLPPQWWIVGIGSALTLSVIVNVILFSPGIHSLFRAQMDREVVVVHIKALIAAGIAGGIGFLVFHYVPWLGAQSFTAALLTCAVVGILISSIYALFIRVAGVHELNDFFAPLTRRLLLVATRRSRESHTNNTALDSDKDEQ